MSGPRRIRSREFWPAMAFLLPNFIGFLAFTAGPVVSSLLLSFTSWDLLTPPRWAGWANFVTLLGFHATPDGWAANDPAFWQYLGNTFFLLLALPVNMAGSLGLALLLNRRLRFRHVYRLVFFLPSILSGVAIFMLWKFMYQPDYGLINVVLAKAGLTGPAWLSNPATAKPALMLMGSWMAVGGTSMILYLAALQNVSRELLEAARIDGAGRWAQFRHVVWPSLAPVTFFIFTMGLIHGLQGGFDAAYIMTDGGPSGATTTLGFYVYMKAYVFFEMGYAAAIAWAMFLLVLVITVLNWKRSERGML
jgi:multiple sugar transport system permease protein